MATNLYMDAQFIRAEIDALLDAYPELTQDEELLLGMLEGETDTIRLVEAIISQRQRALSMQEAIKSRIADLSERASRYGRKEQAMKSLALSIMKAAGLSKLELPEATLSITKPRTSVDVIDVDALPQGYFRLKKEADKTAIKKAFEAGEPVPGATLVTGEAGLTVRTR